MFYEGRGVYFEKCLFYEGRGVHFEKCMFCEGRGVHFSRVEECILAGSRKVCFMKGHGLGVMQ